MKQIYFTDENHYTSLTDTDNSLTRIHNRHVVIVYFYTSFNAITASTKAKLMAVKATAKAKPTAVTATDIHMYTCDVMKVAY